MNVQPEVIIVTPTLPPPQGQGGNPSQGQGQPQGNSSPGGGGPQGQGQGQQPPSNTFVQVCFDFSSLRLSWLVLAAIWCWVLLLCLTLLYPCHVTIYSAYFAFFSLVFFVGFCR